MSVSIDFSALPAPTVIEPLDFDTVYQQIKADILLFDQSLAPVLALESEPVTILAQAFAYRIVKERQAANEKARGIMLALAKGPELDHLGALPWIRTVRKTITAANATTTPPTAAVLEDDEDYRARLQSALDGWSTAGPVGAYKYFAMAADGKVADVSINTPRFSLVPAGDALQAQLPQGSYLIKCDNFGSTQYVPGNVIVAVLGTDGDGTPPAQTLAAVRAKLSSNDVIPLCDIPVVIAASIKPYRIEASIICYDGPSRAAIINTAKDAAKALVKYRKKCGYDITLSAIYSALHQPGVQRVVLTSPAADIPVAWNESAYCTEIVLTDGGVDV